VKKPPPDRQRVRGPAPEPNTLPHIKGQTRANFRRRTFSWESALNSIVYLVGLIVIVLAILSFVGVR
jgi:hypothetical protein